MDKQLSVEIVLESEDYGIGDRRWGDICKELYKEIKPEIVKQDYVVHPKVIKAEKGIDVTLFHTLITVITSPGVGYAIYKLIKLLIETHERIQKGKKLKLRIDGEKLDIDAEGLSEKNIERMMQKILAAKEREKKQLEGLDRREIKQLTAPEK